MKITVMSRRVAEALELREEPHLIISINCPGEDPANICSNSCTLGRVNLFFWDLDVLPKTGTFQYAGHMYDASSIPEDQLVSEADAQKVWDLVETHPGAEEIIVHCTAGRSRSAAIAAALHKILNGSDEPIFGDARYTPNMRVYRVILEEWHRRHPES